MGCFQQSPPQSQAGFISWGLNMHPPKVHPAIGLSLLACAIMTIPSTLAATNEANPRSGQTLELDGAIELSIKQNIPLWFAGGPEQNSSVSRMVTRLDSRSTVSVNDKDALTAVEAVQLIFNEDWYLYSSESDREVPLTLGVQIANRELDVPSRSAAGPATFDSLPVLNLIATDISIDSATGSFVIACEEVIASAEAAARLGIDDSNESSIGTAIIRGRVPTSNAYGLPPSDGHIPPTTAGGIGPDVIVHDLQSVSSHAQQDGISAYTLGTTSCNLGDIPVGWYADTNDHPVIGGSIYRLRNGRIEQLGISWLKHGFAALTGDLCGECQMPPTSQTLGQLCSDPYSATLNGNQAVLGPRSEVNAHSGFFTYPPSNPPWSGTIARRIQVKSTDLDPSMNQGATYFGEGIYITPDDAFAGNANNNASHRRMSFELNANNIYAATMLGNTIEQQPAIRAWKNQDPLVQETDIQVPNDGLFIVSAKASQLGNGFWHYEYAIMNLNSDRSGRYFTIPIPDLIVIQNMGFHDVDYHSGEPYSLTDWTISTGGNAITWSTEGYFDNPYANALRWSTMYNFRFDANVEPAQTTAILGLFKPGIPNSVNVATVGPSLELIDCNLNGIADSIDVNDGTSDDCDSNMVPDECQLDCNMNGVADSCDIASGQSEDCDENTLPDECDPDCDNDGTIDSCEVIFDTDEDGILDCDDDCPVTTPAGVCLCPPVGECCFEFFGCFLDYPRTECCEQGGVPDCAPDCAEPGENCYDGCLLGDYDLDGDLDLLDYLSLGECFSGPNDDPNFVEPSVICRTIFGFDNDNDIDLIDYTEFYERLVGP